MGIDYGKKRVGVALSDEEGKFALPESVLPNDTRLIENLVNLGKERGVGAIIVGESRDFSGKANPIQAQIADFVKELKGVSHLPVFMEQELLTSKEASHDQGEGDMIDASAAALILKAYLDRQQPTAEEKRGRPWKRGDEM